MTQVNINILNHAIKYGRQVQFDYVGKDLKVTRGRKAIPIELHINHEEDTAFIYAKDGDRLKRFDLVGINKLSILCKCSCHFTQYKCDICDGERG